MISNIATFGISSVLLLTSSFVQPTLKDRGHINGQIDQDGYLKTGVIERSIVEVDPIITGRYPAVSGELSLSRKPETSMSEKIIPEYQLKAMAGDPIWQAYPTN